MVSELNTRSLLPGSLHGTFSTTVIFSRHCFCVLAATDFFKKGNAAQDLGSGRSDQPVRRSSHGIDRILDTSDFLGENAGGRPLVKWIRSLVGCYLKEFPSGRGTTFRGLQMGTRRHSKITTIHFRSLDRQLNPLAVYCSLAAVPFCQFLADRRVQGPSTTLQMDRKKQDMNFVIADAGRGAGAAIIRLPPCPAFCERLLAHALECPTKWQISRSLDHYQRHRNRLCRYSKIPPGRDTAGLSAISVLPHGCCSHEANTHTAPLVTF